MIKIAPPASDSFYSFKCGEIFCISPAVYNVTCCLCAGKTHLDQFAMHFQMQHLAMAEKSINLEILECNEMENLTNDESLNAKGQGGPEDDPIKHEDLAAYCDSKDDKSLVQLLNDQRSSNHKLRNDQGVLPIEAENNHLNTGEKLALKNIVKKPKAKNSKKRKMEVLKTPDEDVQLEMKSKDFEERKEEETAEENKCSSNSDKINLEDVQAIDVDRDWLEEDGGSKTDSETCSDSIKDELPYPCLTCKRAFRTKHGLKTHNQIIHNPNRNVTKKKPPKVEHKCDLCNKVFRIARDLESHKWKHTGIFCDICGKQFTQAGNMLRHKQRHTGIKAHKCKECGKEFFTDKELKSHLICHTGRMPVICEICGKQCRHGGALTAHMRRHTGERPAKCDVCGKCFFSIHDLNVHAVAHTSERPFKCDICGSTFQRRKALRVHKLIHSKDRKHICKICGKGFAQSGGLKSHMRSHDAALEKPTTELAQLFAPNVLENSSSQARDYSSSPTGSGAETTNPLGVVLPSENGMLEQYMN